MTSLAEQLYYAHRRYLDGECKICHARPGADGERTHGKGCYDLSEDGGGSDYPEADVDWGTLPEYERAAWERVAEVAREQLAMKARFDATLAQERDKRVGLVFATTPPAGEPDLHGDVVEPGALNPPWPKHDVVVGFRCPCGRDHILNGATTTRTEIEDAAAEQIATHLEHPNVRHRIFMRGTPLSGVDAAIAHVRAGTWRQR